MPELSHMKHGVPQGSILGPLLFVLFINDLPFHITSPKVKIDLYADDTTISFSTSINEFKKQKETLNAVMKDLELWTLSNKLPINETKSKTLLVTGKRLSNKLPKDKLSVSTMNGKVLESVNSVRLLGLDVDNELNFSNHAERMYNKISSRIGILNKIKACLPKKQRILYFNAMVKPLFSYAGAIWQTLSSKDCLTRFLRLQKRAARLILNAEPMAPSVPLFNQLSWLPFYLETHISMCSLLFKRLQLAVPEYLLESL